MSKFLFIFLSLFLFSCDNKEDIRSISDSSEERAWLSWDECGHKIGDNPCDFSLMDQNGRLVDLYDHYGKVIVIDLSTMWCGICNNIADKGDEFSLRYGDENIIWITILIEDYYGSEPDINMLREWQSKFGIQSPILAGSRDMIDPTAENGYPVTGWPTMVVIDRDMTIKQGLSGWHEGMITQWVEELL